MYQFYRLSEINSDSCTIIRLRHNLIVITPNFLLKLRRFVLILSLSRINSEDLRINMVDGERGRGKSENRLETFFQCNLSHQYTERAVPSIGKFCSSYSICSSPQTAVLDLVIVVQELKRRRRGNKQQRQVHQQSACACGQAECKSSTMSKLYGTRMCLCAPSWCHRCAKWWTKPNQT